MAERRGVQIAENIIVDFICDSLLIVPYDGSIWPTN